ncbi:hypothetical protein CEQ90_19595 [Lewinellaceae bacterium SD302]|nr:hypothetical protein CEQ90_19595 [Lewinellaceae bacterium SD302]
MNKHRVITTFILLTLTMAIHESSVRSQEVINIPIVFHVMETTGSSNQSDVNVVSTYKLYEQIHIINKAFNGGFKSDKTDQIKHEFDFHSDYTLKFHIAGCKFGGRNGVVSKVSQFTDCQIQNLTDPSLGGSLPWDIDSFINVYIVDLENCGLSGFSTTCPNANSDSSIIVVDYRYIGNNDIIGFTKGFTLIHELGHYLGLKHPWGADFSNCSEDDDVEDTPYQSNAYYGCPSFPQYSCNSMDYYFTFMDYVDDICMEFFTPDQFHRMIETITNKYPNLLNGPSDCNLDYSRYSFCESINIYPNPNIYEYLSIDFLIEPISADEIFLTNTIGEEITFEITFINDNKARISLMNLAKGMYFISFKGRCTKSFFNY